MISFWRRRWTPPGNRSIHLPISNPRLLHQLRQQWLRRLQSGALQRGFRATRSPFLLCAPGPILPFRLSTCKTNGGDNPLREFLERAEAHFRERKSFRLNGLKA